MQNNTRSMKYLKDFWFKTQFPKRNPINFSRIDRFIILTISVFTSIISSYQLISNQVLNFEYIIPFLITFFEILACSIILIFISKKENPMINSRQILLIIGLLLITQLLKIYFGIFLSPLAIVIPPALIISQGMGTLTALTWVSIAFINWPSSMSDINNYILFITFVCACIVSVLGGKIRSRAQLLQLSIFVPLAACIAQLILIGNEYSLFNKIENLFLMPRNIFYDSLILAIFMLTTILLMPIFEGIFGLLTKARLLELADQEKPLLRRLSIEAPGTFEHTLLICGLAEEATRIIGGDVDLIKTGALYHDVGKLHAPDWFIENQHGKKNPHDELNNPIESAKILQDHVNEGLKFARKHRLPKPIADFIPEHQGTLKMGYFLFKAKEKNIDISEDSFRYKGPIPQSKETAILMLADGCEAALRALDINASDSEAIKTITKIIKSREIDGQLKESNLSISEIYLIKRAFLNVWKRIRHRRIQYPTTKNNTFS